MSKQFSWLNQDWCRFTHLILSHFSLIISTFVSPCCLTHPLFFKQQVAGLNMFSNLNPFFFFREDSGVPPLFPHTQGVGKRKARAVFCFFTRDIDDFPMKTGVIFQPVGSQQGRSKTGSDFRTLDFHECIYLIFLVEDWIRNPK